MRARRPREGREPGAEGMEGGGTAPDGPQQLQERAGSGHIDGDRERSEQRGGYRAVGELRGALQSWAGSPWIDREPKGSDLAV